MKPETVHGLLHLFDILDSNGDGSISKLELQHELRLFGFSPQEIEKFSTAFDLNDDEEITLDEYKIALGIPYDVPLIAKLLMPRYARNAELMRIFAQADVNRDGKISKDELFRLMQGTNIPPNEIKQLFAELDINGDGVITLGEYKLVLGITHETLEQWVCLFRELDRDQSGDISADELKFVFDQAEMSILHDSVEEWIADYDRNGDGKLDRLEFMTFVSHQAEKVFP